MERTREYRGIADVKGLQSAVESVLRRHELEVRSVPEAKGFIVRGRKEGTERDLTGTTYSLSVTARVGDHGTDVTISEDLLGKVAVGAVLAALTGGIGAILPGWFAYRQHRIAEELWEAVDDHLAEVARA